MTQSVSASRSAIAAAVLLAMGASANAGSISATARNVAQEAFGTAVTATTLVGTPAVNYVFSTPGGIVINPGGSINVTLTPTGGTFSPAAGTIVATCPVGTGGNLACTAAIQANGSVDLTLANAATSLSNAVIGVGGTLTLGASNVNGALGLATGTPVTVSGLVSTGASGAGVVLEAASAAGNILTSSLAVNGVAASSSTFSPTAESVKIDLSPAVPANAGKVLTSGGLAGNTAIENVGSVTFTNSNTAALELTGVTAVAVANATAFAATSTYTLSLVSGSFTAGVSYALASAADCTGAVASTQAPVATSVTGSTTSITLSSAVRPTTGTPVYICATFPAATITPYQPSVAATLDAASTSFIAKSVSATPLYTLTNNGQVVDVQNYIPSAVSGYIQTIRIINTGTVAATPTIALISEAGVVGTAVSVGTSIPAGGALKLTQATVESLLGAQVSSARPRIRITAATNGMKVQSFFNNANGAYTNLSGIEQ